MSGGSRFCRGGQLRNASISHVISRGRTLLTNFQLTILLGTGCATSFMLWYVYFPGMLNADSMDMLCQAAYARYHTLHSPLFSLLWRPLNALVQGPPLMLAFIISGYVFSALFFVKQLTKSLAGRIFGLLVLIVWPPVLNIIGVVGKDSMLLLIYLFFVGLLYSNMNATMSTLRMIAIWMVAFVGSAIRMEAIVLFAGILAVAYGSLIGRNLKPDGAVKVQCAVGLGLFVATCALGIGIVIAFNSFILHATERFSIQAALGHDLAGISARTNENVMPAYIKGLGVKCRGTRKALYTP
jgi:hypothetical protein